MKVAIFPTFLLAAVLSNSVAASDSLSLKPYNLLEELRTGAISIKKDQLSTDKGEKAELRLMKQREDEYGSKIWYYKVVDDDIYLCNDGSKADYMQVNDLKSSVVLLAYQDSVNPETKKKYVYECGDYLYSY